MAGRGAIVANIISRFDKSGIDNAQTGLSRLGGKLKQFGKVAGAAFATAGAAAAVYAGKLLVDGVKAAIKDQAAQVKLATALKNVTGATKKQVAAVEDQISKMSLAYGIADDELRPSFQKLVQATGNSTKAFKLQKLALDISAGSGKSLESVSVALSKAALGNTSALTRLGVPLDANAVKAKDANAIFKSLGETFEGQAAKQADTFEGKMARLNVAFDEAKETVGGFVLDALTPMVDGFVNQGIPKISEFADTVGKKLSPIIQEIAGYVKTDLIPAIQDLAKWIQDKIVPLVMRMAKVWTDSVLPALKWVVAFIIDYVVPVIQSILEPVLVAIVGAFEKISKAIQDNKEKFEPLIQVIEVLAGFIRDTLAPIVGKILGKAFEIIGDRIAFVIELFANIISTGKKVWDFFGGIKQTLTNAFNGVANIIMKPFKIAFNAIAGFWNNSVGKVSFKLPDWVPKIGGKGFAFPKIPMLANGGIVTKPTLALIGEAGAEAVIPLSRKNQMGGGITFNISGAIDPEGTARQIQRILNRSDLRAGAF